MKRLVLIAFLLPAMKRIVSAQMPVQDTVLVVMYVEYGRMVPFSELYLQFNDGTDKITDRDGVVRFTAKERKVLDGKELSVLRTLDSSKIIGFDFYSLCTAVAINKQNHVSITAASCQDIRNLKLADLFAMRRQKDTLFIRKLPPPGSLE